ncbi:hypothetical protein DAEQUDRAFT_268089 [Daedalea quercina L-15889]|uniref:4Fe-4S ferredoxin-type domain-containing protein n=1 Tax=Daedalea quercina L-15889 TaxID=1314783 RepID=A0A165QAM0_9APHY|nr:hypothetical protein DAEQUDRAFT_268089 [Daedalea quercina L-15889]
MPVDPPVKQNPAARQRRTVRKESEELKAESSTYAREIELKRSRGEISCAECRRCDHRVPLLAHTATVLTCWHSAPRLKIRCDKTIPCQSCQRRGCAALCPNGSLATGQGTRFVLAATEHLHRRIAKMSERVRELEDALAIVQAKCSDQPHPLLVEGDVQAMKQDLPMTELTEQIPSGSRTVIDSFGMLSLSDHGASSTFFGPTGGSEYLLVDNRDTSKPSTWDGSDPADSPRNSKSPPMSDRILRASDSFPLTFVGPPADLHESLLEHLPSYEQACRLAESYVEHAAWLFRGVTTEQIMQEMLPFIYGQPVESEDGTPIEYSSPHDLALLYMIFAIGCLVDFNHEPGSKEAEQYEQLARAAMSLKSVWVKPSLSTVQTLHLFSIYNGMAEDDLRPDSMSMELSWGELGLAGQVCQILGLHRDSSRWGLPEKLVYRRRLLFWNIFEADAWQALGTGRPPCFSRSYVDCQAAQVQDLIEKEDMDSVFEEFFMRFSYECVSVVAMKTLAVEPPTYETIMELDRHVRDFPIPPEAVVALEDLAPPPDTEPPTVVNSMEMMVMSHSREVLLLYIHRTFFAQAIIDCPTNPVKSEYAHSFLTAYRAAVVVLKTVKQQFVMFPNLCARIWPIWAYAFSAAVVFGMVATRGPRSPQAQQAMSNLEIACDLFAKGSQHSRRAARANSVVVKLREKAMASLAAARGLPLASLPVAGSSRHDVQDHEQRDELEIFAGRRTVSASNAPRRASLSPARPGPSAQTGQIASPTSADSLTSHTSYLSPPHHPNAVPTYSMPGPSNLGGWTVQQQQQQQQQPQIPVSSYPHSDQWYRQDVYPQPPATHEAWAEPHQTPHASVPQHQHGSMMQSYQNHPQMDGVQQNYRHLSHAYPGPLTYQGVHTPYEPPPELVGLGLASREGNVLDARWTSIMHESGFLDDVNFRT